MKTARHLAHFFPAALWLAVIFFFSGQTGKETASLSLSLTHWLLRLFPGAPEAALHLWLRKAAHIAVYLVEGALLFPALRGALKGTAKGFFSTVALCALIAIVDEAHKALIPGRHCSWDEAGLNVLGAFLGALLAAFLAGRCRRRAGNDAAPGE